MPYLMLILGLLIGLIALYRFFMQANVKQIKALFLTAVFTVICAALFFLAITGRFPAALALLVALAPIVLGFYNRDALPKSHKPEKEPDVSTQEEALEILGLKAEASEEEIEKAYKKLMQKVHPDNEGSDWLAAKLNQARDLLLREKRS